MTDCGRAAPYKFAVRSAANVSLCLGTIHMAHATSRPEISNSSIKALVCEPCWTHFFNFDAFQKALATKSNPESKAFSYTLPWETIRASVAEGCNWCNLLSEQAKKGTGECTVRISFSTETGGYTPAGVKKLTLGYGSKDNSMFGERSYRLYTTANDLASQIIRPRDRILQVNAPSSFKLALGCRDRCMQTHDECPKHIESNLPDRVIDCSNLERPKLVVTNNVRGVYATLSYVWGRNQTIVSTTKNVDSFIKDGIDMQSLPPTIRDAMISAHNLGVQYLWIDAFCILQDSDEDKGRQIGKMNKIYMGAYFTIIAACASGVDEGFLQDRPARIPSAHVPFVCPDGKIGSVFLTSTEMVGYDVTQMYHDEMEPVSSRGWCFQEHVLSERSFVFAADTLKYQCQKEIVSIGDAFCEPTTGPRLPKAFSSDGTLNLTPHEKLWARRSWLYVIWEYSRRTLSKPDIDILNALGGVAEQYHYVWRTRYYAGLWEHTFLEDLLWRLESAGGDPSPRPGIYRAPSWSWASVNGQIQVPNMEDKFKPGANDIGQCALVHCEVTPTHRESLFSAVSAAYAKLEAFLYKATVSSGVYSKKETRKLFLDVGADGSQQGQCIGSIRPDSTEDIVDIDRVWVAPILWDRSGYKWVEALVVVAADGGSFRRIGLLRTEGDLRWVETGERTVVTLV
ncbi:hypothetical protein CVT25_012079 [Psilocybe cyanescens]|uniref:Heterokaryon incompatibility domain-containing protein n=1 Tax=Psilocybe cyanescens TaxID=93625 RepID=A0A409VMT3_PSICY|nr:hypothetical protein CVT25_012079 [Psilocybe cyanescens]